MYPKVPTALNFLSNSKFFCDLLRKLTFFLKIFIFLRLIGRYGTYRVFPMLSYQSGYISYLSFRQTLGLDTTRQQKYKTGFSKKGTGTASDPELPYLIRNYCNRSRITVTDPEKYRFRCGRIPLPYLIRNPSLINIV